jgi:hypothetical protein
MNRQILINGELHDVYQVKALGGGWVMLLVGLEGVPFGAHNVPGSWWRDRQAPGVKTGGNLYRHAEV